MRDVFDALSPCSPFFVTDNKMYAPKSKATRVHQYVNTQPSVAPLELMAKVHFDEDVGGR